MPTITFTAIQAQNTIAITGNELMSSFLSGIPLTLPDGTEMPISMVEGYILQQMVAVENELSIIINKQVISENNDFNITAARAWGFMSVTYPIERLINVSGNYNNGGVYSYPLQWNTIAKIARVQDRPRNIRVIPNNGGVGISNGFSGLGFILYYQNYGYLPNFWEITYGAGYDVLPPEIVSAIAKLAAVDVLNIMGDVAFGAGLAGYSLSIDGVNQSITTTNSSTSAGFTARVNLYGKELKDVIMPNLRRTYKKIALSVA